MGTQTCLFFMPIWPPGHVIPMVEAAKHLLQIQTNSISKLSITFLLMQPPNSHSISNISTSYLQSLQSLNLPIHFQNLPSVDPPTRFDGPEDFVSIYTQLHLPHVRDAVTTSNVPVTGFVLDLFATSLIDLSNKLKIPSYIFFTSNASFLSLMLHLPTLDEKIKQEFWELGKEVNIKIPGISPIPPHLMPPILMNKKSAVYSSFVNHGRRFLDAKGIIVNSNLALESEVFKAISEGQCEPGKPVPELYPIGPIISIEPTGTEQHECVKWLNLQPSESVIFVCFGSRGGFEMPQVKEIANGLDNSGHRFLWAIQQPSSGIRFPTKANLEEILPKGFIERTKERGLVWPSWVPQPKILAHNAVGGFITHCGWNSCLESLWFGVPMIPWPLYAEQSLNAFVMVNDMRVAVNLNLDVKNDGFVKKEEIERAVRCLMDGSDEAMRVRVRVGEIKLEFRKAVEEGGSSCVQLRRLAGEFGGLEKK
ncbi:hypothetical protein LUZ60_005426 [Juncus effusus]|nr:hypothetical protein LUZ60_005426 [Juncus effusus]